MGDSASTADIDARRDALVERLFVAAVGALGRVCRVPREPAGPQATSGILAVELDARRYEGQARFTRPMFDHF